MSSSNRARLLGSLRHFTDGATGQSGHEQQCRPRLNEKGFLLFLGAGSCVRMCWPCFCWRRSTPACAVGVSCLPGVAPAGTVKLPLPGVPWVAGPQ